MVNKVIEIGLREELREYLSYDIEDGHFYWIRNHRRSLAGTRAGRQINRGYWAIRVLKYDILAHRLVWLFVYGYCPKYIDHINGDSSNNRLDNLRECTMSENQANRNDRVRGIEAHGRKFRARIVINKQRIELGSFAMFDEAVVAYDAAAAQYFGEFARCNRPEV